MLARVTLAALTLCVALPTSAASETRNLAANLPDVGAFRPDPLAALRSPPLRARWEESIRLEESRQFAASAALRKELASDLPEDVHLRWRIARDWLRAAETLRLEGTPALPLYEEALGWARSARALDPSCGECCLYEFASLARVATDSGPLPSPGRIRELGSVLAACLENPPTWSDGPWNHERANLYYGAASFYRRVPDSAWIRWVAGVRGDPELAVAYGRRAVELAPQRTDYHLELGASLLCLSERRDSTEAHAEGISWLRRVPQLPDLLATDGIDRQRASALLENPDRACSESRAAFLRRR